MSLVDVALHIPVSLKGRTFSIWLERFLDRVGTDSLPPQIRSRAQLIRLVEAKTFDSDRRQYEAPYTNRFAALLKRYGREAAQTVISTNGDVESVLRTLRDLNTDLEKLYRALYSDVGGYFYNRVSRRIADQLKAGDFDVEDPFDNRAFQQWFHTTTGQKITAIDAATRTRIIARMRQGLDEGIALPKLARELSASYTFSRVRALRIARTEIIAASNSTTHFGISTHVSTTGLIREWIATLDSRTRSTHRYGIGVGGQKRKWGKAYNVGRSQMMFPGDTSLGAEAREIINCRCTEGFKRDPRAVKPPPVKPKPVPTTVRPPRTPKPKPSAPVSKRPATWSEAKKRIRSDTARLQARADKLREELFRAQNEAATLWEQLGDQSLPLSERAVIARKREAVRKRIKRLAEIRGKILDSLRHVVPKYFNPTGKPGNFVLHNGTRATYLDDHIKQVNDWVNDVLGDQHLRVRKMTVGFESNPKKRSSFLPDAKTWSGKIRMAKRLAPGAEFREVLAHEFGHAMEYAQPRISKAANSFLARRTKGESAVSLRKLTGLNYKSWETTKKDKFYSPYIGKQYPSYTDLDGNTTQYTEVFSMALQHLYADPVGLLNKDPNLAAALWHALNGKP